MWLVINRTPYVADRTWVQDKDGNKIWMVAVKATFDIAADGTCHLSDEQVPLFRMGQPVADLGKSSLIHDADLAGVKPCTDFLVHGSAWVPNGGRAAWIDIGVTIGPIEKRLRVFGDRHWERGMGGGVEASQPAYFDSMPIVYERAYGGWDTSDPDPSQHRLEARNPVGTGFALQPQHCIGRLLPNIENPQQLIESWDNRPAPAGLNALDCHWSPRRELAGTYDESWLANRFPLWAEDFDPRYNNCAPADQQVPGYLRGGETVELVNLCAVGRMTFMLPRIYPFFETRFGSKRIEHRCRLCTVVVEPDLQRVIMVWQTSLVCNRREVELDATVVTEKVMI
jgi:hypothetical protein